MQSRSRRQKNSRIARIELVTATTRTGRTSNTGLPRSRSRSPLRERAVAPSVQRSPRARNSCRRAFLLRELRTRSWSFSFGWYRDVMQLGATTPSAMHPEGPEPRHELTVVYRQECPEIVRHSIKSRRTSGFSLTSDDYLLLAPPTEGGALDASAGRLVGRTTMGSGAS